MISKHIFEKGLLYHEYLENMRELREITEDIENSLIIEEEIRKVVYKKVNKRKFINILCIAEPFCGDSACNLPIVKKLFDIENTALRIFIRSLNPDIENILFKRGVKKIPVFVFYDSDFNEIATWIERPQKAHILIEDWKKKNSEFEKLKNSRNINDMLKFKSMYRELVNFMKTNYINSLWKETAKEILSLL